MHALGSPRDGNVDQPATYKYEPLREGDDIRLLSLRPRKLDNIIWADLETVSVGADRNCYDAISYTWADGNGDAEKCCSLRIGSQGLLLPITRNCDSVLRRVHKYTDRVWIDAVCIDQDNFRERGHQVDLMPQIYKSALRTFAYVGEASEDSEFVLKNLAEGIWIPPHPLHSFFARPYFSRVWVVQEVALSKSIIMMCGDTAVEWTGFMQGECMRQLYTSSYYDSFPTVFRLSRQHNLGAATLLDALLLGRSCNASDPRDKVFGLLGIVCEEDRPPANYSLSTAEVYMQIVMYLFKVQKRGLDVILGNLCHRSDESRVQMKDLPHWVPDWSQCGRTFLERVPQALGFLKAQRPGIFQDNDGMALLLDGRILGALETFEEHADITDLHMYLFNSRSRESKELPPAYKNRRVYVFAARSDIWESRWEDEQPLEQWEDRGRFSSQHNVQKNEYYFLVARASCSESAQSNLSALRESKRQGKVEACGGAIVVSKWITTGDANFGKASKELRDARNGRGNFELLGLVKFASSLTLSEIVARMSILGNKYQTEYIIKPCTIRIV